jgi:hypothetical protein
MIIRDEATINIEGQDYFTVDQFSKLTNKSQQTIRVLILKGNRIRKLVSKSIGGKPFILSSELFEFPFVTTGRPSPLGIPVERFILDEKDGHLKVIEENFNKCQ